jgi:hypothetical protein
MTEANKGGSSWTAMISGLPASLIFIIVVDWQLFPGMIDLYKSQNTSNDILKVYTLEGIGVFVLVNLFIIASFARVRYLHEKSKVGSKTPDPIVKEESA